MISSISDASLVEPGSAVNRPGHVGEEHQQLGAEQVGHQGGQPVVVAEADLVIGDGVVFVDDRDDAEVEQARQRLPGVQVLLAVRRSRGAPAGPAPDQVVAGQGTSS